MTADSEAAPRKPVLDPATVSELLAQSLEACTAWNRADLAAKLRLSQIRLSRPSTLVCVVGEFKQGKSQLIDALIGAPVCPVDDDVATSAITAVYGTDTPVARVRRVVDGEATHEEVDVEQLRQYVTEEGNSRDLGIELVEVGIPSPALAEGLTLVDTPGAGGLLQQHTSSTLRFLRLADAVIFVTDASQELTATEVAFLERVPEVCPNVMVVITKIDLFPEWRRILELDEGHLSRLTGDHTLVPVSSSLQIEGVARSDPDLEQESGIPGLLATIRSRILEGAKQQNARRATKEMRWAIGRLLHPIEAGLEILDDHTATDGGMERLEATQERLKELQAVGSRWSTLLTDGFTDLRSEVDYRLRTSVRETLSSIDAQLEEIDPASDWVPFTHDVQEGLSVAVADVFTGIDTGAEAIRDRITALLSDDEELVPDLRNSDEPDVAAMWEATDRDLAATGTGVKGALSSGLTALRGASSGMILLGVMGNLAGVALAAPVSLGAAVIFGTKQVLDTRKTALKQRRQEARTVVRQYVDEVNLELGKQTRQLVQDSHRTLRDHYSARLQELSRSTAEALHTAQEGLAQGQSDRQQRSEQLRQWVAQLRHLLDQLPTPEDSEAR